MAHDPTAKANLSALHSGSNGAAQEADVYGALGSLLGVLEVIVTDEATPVSGPQLTRIRTALGIAQRLQQYVEALLTLAADDLPQRLRRARCSVRPMVEHAVRGGVRATTAHQIALRWPADGQWGAQRVHVDASRLDRALSALIGALAAVLGAGGVLSIELGGDEEYVVLKVRGEPGPAAPRTPAPFDSGLLERACRRLLELQGGGFSLAADALGFEIALPIAEEP